MLKIKELRTGDKIVCIKEFVLVEGEYCPKCNYELKAPLIVKKGTVVELYNPGWNTIFITAMFNQFGKDYTKIFSEYKLKYFKKLSEGKK